MSIGGAVNELNQEIERLTQIRDSLLQVPPKSATSSGMTAAPVSPAKKSAPAKKPGPKKGIEAKKAAAKKLPTPAGKRVVSAATRQKMSDAAKARSAAKKTSGTK